MNTGIKELLEDFLAMGYDDDVALELAKQECARRNAVAQKNAREANVKLAKKGYNFVQVNL